MVNSINFLHHSAFPVRVSRDVLMSDLLVLLSVNKYSSAKYGYSTRASELSCSTGYYVDVCTNTGQTFTTIQKRQKKVTKTHCILQDKHNKNKKKMTKNKVTKTQYDT